MKIAIFCQQLEYMGGIERVVLEQVRIFKTNGVKVVLLLEREPVVFRDKLETAFKVLENSESTRRAQLASIFEKWQPEYILFHGVSHQHAELDIEVSNKCGVKSICVVHFPFVSNIALGSGAYNSWRVFYETGKACTSFATVSGIDEIFWRGLGKRAFHVQNPFVHPKKDMEGFRRLGEAGKANLVWVGRLCEQKQPKSALAAFALAARKRPSLHLTMVGGDARSIKPLARYAKDLGVADAVEFVPERPDINEYWAKADIHLLTSICESFCLVWAEAKAAGIPTVMFDLPYLDLSKDKCGYIAVEQKDVYALADAIVELVDNPAKRLEMGLEAKQSLAPFNDKAVWESWSKVFQELKSPSTGFEVNSDVRTIVEQMYFAVKYDKETHRWPEDMEIAFNRLTKCSLRPLARGFQKFLGFLEHARRGVLSIGSKINL